MVIVVKPEPGSPTKSSANRATTTSNYDPRIVYILELAAMLAIKDERSSATIGREVAEALQNVVRGSANSHPLIVSRAVFYLLHLLNASHVSSIPSA
jgi:brefeldin A-resistance guanine nucleotide exchange factor 1